VQVDEATQQFAYSYSVPLISVVVETQLELSVVLVAVQVLDLVLVGSAGNGGQSPQADHALYVFGPSVTVGVQQFLNSYSIPFVGVLVVVSLQFLSIFTQVCIACQVRYRDISP